MKVINKIKVPTGHILVVEGSKGKLELLSLYDYGKDKNLKADFMGLTSDPGVVSHGDMLPLDEKWVITISTQYGCSMMCNYCDVPKVGPGRNATFNDMVKQIITGLHVHPEIKSTKRLNIHYARMGEPTWNPDVLDVTKWLKEHIDPEYKCHPVISTMMPKKNIWLKTFIHTYMRMKNRMYFGNAGLQISLNSTNEEERGVMFNGNSLEIEKIAKIMDGIIPIGRKITLNFPVCDWEIDPKVLLKYFDPDNFLVKLTPMHKTTIAQENAIKTEGDYTSLTPYKETEERIKKAGYDVIVFITSEYEDTSRITCGNAILSGTPILSPHEVEDGELYEGAYHEPEQTRKTIRKEGSQ